MAEAPQHEALRVRLWGALSLLGLVFAALTFGLDQTFKWWMLHVVDIESRQPIALLPVFDVVLAWNEGISYGWLAGGASQAFLIALSVAISLAFGYGWPNPRAP
jgi:signal peptidase II